MHKFIAHNYHPSQFPSTSTSAASLSGSGSGSGPVSRRSACDRCRAQKLRCIRDDASVEPDSRGGGCRRCLKMGADCLATINSKRSTKRGVQRQQNKPSTSTSTFDVENIPTLTNTSTSTSTSTSTDTWLSWDLLNLNTLAESESRDTEMQNFNDDNNNNGQFDILAAPDNEEGFRIFDPMLFINDSNFLHHEEEEENPVSVELVQQEKSNQQEEKQKEKGEEDEINLHTIATNLERYLAQLDGGPPEITLSKILFTTSSPSTGEDTEEKKSNSCQRAHTIDSILQHTTHFINTLKSSSSSSTIEKKETQTLLRILTIYTIILKLFLILFAHIHVFLEDATTSSTTAVPTGKKKTTTVLEPVPDVQFIGFDIQSGHLQATLFMQIVTHLIRSMESLLGIPSEHRLLNTKEVDCYQHNDGTAEIIKAVMHREAAQRKDAVRGYGGVPALRAEMDAVTELLEHLPL